MIKTTLPPAHATGDQNNISVDRLMAAIIVPLSKAWVLFQGEGTSQLIKVLTGSALGKMSVLMFFILLNFLISYSANSSQEHIRDVIGPPLIMAFACGIVTCLRQQRIALPLTGLVSAAAASIAIFTMVTNPLVRPLYLNYLLLCDGVSIPLFTLSAELYYWCYLYGRPVAPLLLHMGTVQYPFRLAFFSLTTTHYIACLRMDNVEKRRLIGNAQSNRQNT